MTPTIKSKLLEFQLIGEGTLPSVCVLRPALRDNRGSPVLQFRRILVGRRTTLPLVLLNDGNVPSQVRDIYTVLTKVFETGTNVNFTKFVASVFMIQFAYTPEYYEA